MPILPRHRKAEPEFARMLMRPAEIAAQIGGDPRRMMRVARDPMAGTVRGRKEPILMLLRAVAAENGQRMAGSLGGFHHGRQTVTELRLHVPERVTAPGSRRRAGQRDRSYVFRPRLRRGL